ncbi:MAG TPA: chromosome segregation protein SMC [Acidimicrobiales bacterium]|nr:chromosome segregation protein SMC [Acidimicrobiales bacterium]
MFLKSLTLKGFKSFADATSLEFEPGITVVVGPNGSGKSNIVDAVAWVLGAQGPRTVRSQKMEDVIFAGSAKRPALGRAEVSLTIDNANGLLPIEFSEVTITRTLFRNGDSEYAINGVPCRLLDIQELLSDSGVGRQQHVIVSQGQLAAILDARPEDRRLIIEEAAGVLKYRRRREKAQRRLEATEGNLLRLQDLLREVRRQLRPLERQADAARRHGSLVEESQGIRLFLAGREISTLQARLESGARSKVELAKAEAEVRQALARLDADVAVAEAGVSAQGTDDLGDSLLRFEGLRERARGVAAVLAERRRSIERELAASVDEGVIASLESDASSLAAQLQAVSAEAEGLVPQHDELGAAEQSLAAERAAFEAEWGDDSAVPAVGGEAAEVRGELSALRSAAQRGRGEVSKGEARLAALQQKGERLDADIERRRTEVAEADAAEKPLVEALEAAESARAAAEAVLADAEETLRTVDQERQTWTARADALALALDEARARAGAERLADVPGVVGTLLELVEVDEGWEAAFEAAAGEAIAAVVVDGVETARAALSSLRAGDAGGAVLALDAVGFPASLALDAAAVGGEPVRSHVRSRLPSVDRLLDTLLGHAVAVDGGWERALDLALLHPGVVAVTREGDRFAATGWRAGAGGTGATGAALEEARSRADDGTARVAAAREALAGARSSLSAARSAEADLATQLDANDSRLTAAGDALQRLETERRDVAVEQETVGSHLDELRERVEREEARVAELESMLPALEAEEAAGAERVMAMRSARSRLEERVAAVAALRRDLEVRAAGLDERRTLLTRRLAEVEDRLHRNVSEREAAASRRVALEARAVATARLSAMVGERLAAVEAALAALHEQRRRHTDKMRAAIDRLEQLRRERSTAERQLSELRERAQRGELEEAEVRLRLEAAVETLRREFDCEPETATKAECPVLPEGVSASARARELDRELRLMGPINPLALEEFTALQERHTFLEAQLEDVRSGRRELSKVIKAIDNEIVEVFAAAYADVAENFTKLFSTLFPGGTGKLKLTEPDNLLDTGIEVEARPSGKNVKKLSLLSGGERSLTALAFLFAVFRSRPSPFYLMDEVEAALDDVNLHRFIDLINEFRQEAQLLVVSHQKRTMEAADCLYGVTMAPGGSTKVVSEKVAAGA